MTNTRGISDFWYTEINKARVAEKEVKDFENMITLKGRGDLMHLVENAWTYTSGMRIFGFSATNPLFDDFNNVHNFIKEAMEDSPKTSVRDLIASWTEDLMEQAYARAIIYMNVVPFEPPFSGVGPLTRNPIVPTNIHACFPTLCAWGAQPIDKKRKFNRTSSSPTYKNSSLTKKSQPAAPRKSMPSYHNASTAYDSPLPNPAKTRAPTAPVKYKGTTKKVVRVLLWGDAGGVDGYGGGI